MSLNKLKGSVNMEKIYNPMSKEFQDERKRLGITGRQLAAKYQREGKSVEKGIYKRNDICRRYTEKELLDILVQSYKDLGRPPTQLDFTGNPRYPSIRPYINNFESFENAKKLVGLDVESMVRKGVIETVDQKRRFSEMIIRDHFENNPVDLAGKNKCSPWDGICPNGKTYDVKSSKFYKEGHYVYGANNKHKEEIEIYYLLGFNEDYTRLDYGWRIPGEIVESNQFRIGLYKGPRRKFTVEGMKQYDITEKLREILVKYGYFEKIKNYIKAKEKGMTIYEIIEL